MRKLVTTLALILMATLAMAQRSEGTGVAYGPGRSLVGKLPKLTTNGVVDGKVVMSIKIDKDGSVVEASPFEESCTISNEGVIEAVRSAALRAHFTENPNVQTIQNGSITYTFVSTGKDETDKDALKFMGIPVGGSEAEMINALKAKGFKKESYCDYLTGVFNGEDVKVYISTNHGVVDRIEVVYPDCPDGAAARVKFNNLMSRFDHNAKYVSLDHRAEIGANETIFTNIRGNSKLYDVIYFYLTPETNPKQWKIDFNAEYAKRFTKPVKSLCYDELEEVLFCMPLKIRSAISGVVWFAMPDAYYIHIYYDNLQNRPRGEDL